MVHKKIKSTSCCTQNKRIPFLLIGAIIIILLWVIFIPTKKSDSPSGEKENIETPPIEIISDTENVQPLEEEILINETEVISEPKIIENPVIELDVPNGVVAPEMSDSEKLVYTFLTDYNQKKFEEACDLLVDSKCDATSKGSVARFGEELEKMKNGYQNISVRQVEVPDFHSEIVCVEYDYRYISSSNTNPIHETMSFYVQDGKITYRICENKTRDGETISCPIKSRRDFCL